MAGEDQPGLTIRCAWCGALIQGIGDAPDETVSHGICERCAPTVIAEIEARLNQPGTPTREQRDGAGGQAE